MWLAPRLDFEEQLEELMSQHKDLWEFHVSHSKPFLPFSPSSLAEPGQNSESPSRLHSSHPPHSVPEQAVTAIHQNPLQSDPHHHPHCHPVSSSSLVLPTHPCCLPRALQWSGGILMN